jgi:hypothetical protein
MKIKSPERGKHVWFLCLCPRKRFKAMVLFTWNLCYYFWAGNTEISSETSFRCLLDRLDQRLSGRCEKKEKASHNSLLEIASRPAGRHFYELVSNIFVALGNSSSYIRRPNKYSVFSREDNLMMAKLNNVAKCMSHWGHSHGQPNSQSIYRALWKVDRARRKWK